MCVRTQTILPTVSLAWRPTPTASVRRLKSTTLPVATPTTWRSSVSRALFVKGTPLTARNAGVYDEEKQIEFYLNRADVRHQLGVDKEAHGGVKKFIGCSDQVGFRFSATGDQCVPLPSQVEEMS